MINALRRLEKQGDLSVNPYKASGKKRRRNTFPDDAFIEFKIDI